MATIIIDGVNLSNLATNGRISIKNGKVVIDRKEVTDLASYKGPNVTIIVQGDVGDVSLDSGTLEVQGNAQSVNTLSGDATIRGSVSGNVSTMSGDVKAGAINGNCSTMSGDIIQK